MPQAFYQFHFFWKSLVYSFPIFSSLDCWVSESVHSCHLGLLLTLLLPLPVLPSSFLFSQILVSLPPGVELISGSFLLHVGTKTKFF
jgi:hypothetical protein